MWGYYWGYTAAQIELIAIDVPIVVYNNKNKNKKGKGEFSKVNANVVNDKAMEWEKKYANEDGSIKIDLEGFA